VDTAPDIDLDQLSTEELRHRAFSVAARRRDIGFFWSIFRHLPHADDAQDLDASLGAVGASVSDAISLWREFTGHEYGDAEPLLRAAFISYLSGDSDLDGEPDADEQEA
jgi:hypothetical protein